MLEQAAQALTNYDPPTRAELTSDISGLNNISTADVLAQAAQALTNYDPPTYAETLAWANQIGTSATIADAVWDEILTGATHNIATSAGRRLRELASTVVYTGTAASGAATSITLDSGASATDGAYDPALIAIIGGTGAGQSRLIMEYVGSTRTAYVDRDWKVNPSSDSEFIIYADAGREHTNEGVLTGATASTAVLNALASDEDDVYNHCMIFIRGGTGADQVRHIRTYDGATHTVTVGEDWTVTPAAGSIYTILPFLAVDDEHLLEQAAQALTNYDAPTAAELTSGLAGLNDPTAAAVADAVWDEALGDHTTAGSAGEALKVIRQAEAGKLVVDSSANQIVFYDTNDTTVLVTMSLTQDSPAASDITRTPS